MKKAAFFVEGESELEFMSKLLVEIAGQKRITIVQHKLFGGGKSGISRGIQYIGRQTASNEEFQAWIYNCSADNRVNTDILDNHETLKNQGFDYIIGLKDLRGDKNGVSLSLSDLPRMELADRVIARMSSIPTSLIIAVMEIETWFLSETNHYPLIDQNLNQTLIASNQSSLGFNPFTDDLTLRVQPAEDLRKIYRLVRKTYNKKKNVRIRTINALDYSNIYFNLRNNILKIDDLISSIDDFLTNN